MKTWKALAVPVAGLVLLTAACNGEMTGDDPAATETTSTAEAITTTTEETPSPSTTEETASVEQWASVIAEQRNSYDDTDQSWEDATCSSLAAVDGAVDCQAMMMSMGLVAATANVTISGATNPDGPAYIGKPPAEIRTLLIDTLTAAMIAEDAFTPVDMDCFDEGIECAGEASEAERAWDTLGDKYAAWDPYL